MQIRSRRIGVMAGLLAGLILAVALPLIAQNVPCYLDQGGAGWHLGSGCTGTVESGGVLNVASGGALKLGGTTLTPTAAEFNVLAGVTPGTAAASKAAVLGANKNLDTLVIADSGLKLGAGAGTAVTKTAAQLNNLIGSTAGGKLIIAGQQTTVAASDTVVTGLTTVTACLAVLDSDPTDDPETATCSIGDQAGAPAAGSILIKTWKNTGGTDPTLQAAGTFSKKVNWIAFGT